MTHERHPPIRSFRDFDIFLGQQIGLYLGGTITAEELRRRFHSAGTQGNRDNIFPVLRPNQLWHFYDGSRATFETIVHGDLEFFAPDYTLGPRPEHPTDYDPGEYPEEGLRRRIVDDWIPQLEANYGPGIVAIRTPDQHYLDRRSTLAAELVDIHRRYVDGASSGLEFADHVIGDFRNRRDAQDLHHYQFEAAIWDAGILESAVIDADRDLFRYDGREPARRRLDAIIDAFPELR